MMRSWFMVLVLFVFVSNMNAQEYRDFTGSNGKIITAQFIEFNLENETVKIKLKSGKEQNVKLSLFSKEDQNWIMSGGSDGTDNPFGEGSKIADVVQDDNYVENGSFEEGNGNFRTKWQRQETSPSVNFGISKDSHDGQYSATIESKNGGAGVWRQVVKIKPNTRYRFSFWYKAENVRPAGNFDCGLEHFISVGTQTEKGDWKGSGNPDGYPFFPRVKGNKNWTYFEQIVKTTANDTHILFALRFGACMGK